jgi:hypothetical protein
MDKQSYVFGAVHTNPKKALTFRSTMITTQPISVIFDDSEIVLVFNFVVGAVTLRE